MVQKKICSVTTIAMSTQTFVLESMKEMQKRGWDVTLICNMNQQLIDKIPEGMHYYNVPMERSFSLTAAIKSTWQLIKIFRKERFSIVQYGTTHAALFGSFAAWLTRIPVRIHLQWGIYNFWEMGMVGKIYKFVEWITCWFSTTIRPVSHKNLKVAEEIGLFKPGKGKVLGEGGTIGVNLNDYPLDKKAEWCNAIREKYGIESDSYVFGFIGRLSKDKGNNELIQAFKDICDGKNMTLLLVGPDEGTLDKELSEWAHQSKQVVFTGGVPHDDMPKHLAAMDVLVHPTYREGFGMVLQEAMAMEVSIITTDIPGPSEVIEEGVSGVLVPAKDEVALAKAMDDFYGNQTKAAEYGKNGRKRAEKYFNRPIMIDNICKDKEELLNELNKNK